MPVGSGEKNPALTCLLLVNTLFGLASFMVKVTVKVPAKVTGQVCRPPSCTDIPSQYRRVPGHHQDATTTAIITSTEQ